MAISSGTRSEASAPSVQRARKTTRVVNRRVNLDKEKATRGAGASQAMNVEVSSVIFSRSLCVVRLRLTDGYSETV